MTSLDPHSVTVKACGKQAQSARQTAPAYGISKVGREQCQKVYISEDHIRTAELGRQSPKGGPIYELHSTLEQKGQTFSKGARDMNGMKKTSTTRNRPGEWAMTVDDPDDIPTNDALGAEVDSQPFKYRREAEIIIGTEPRGKLKGAELIKNHSAAFYGRASPGPASIGDKYGPDYLPTKERMAMARPFGGKYYNPSSEWMKFGDNPPGVGPGAHDRRDVAIGQQHLSRRRNQTVNAFPHQPKFPKNTYQDTISELDAARSCMGKQVLCKNRSESSVTLKCSDRDSRAKTYLCMTPLDQGPKATMPKFTCSMPRLPAETHIMKSSIG